MPPLRECAIVTVPTLRDRCSTGRSARPRGPNGACDGKGAIQFGLVTIPVKLSLATESKGISFNMLPKTDLSRIQMKRLVLGRGRGDLPGDTVKGYEYFARRIRRDHR